MLTWAPAQDYTQPGILSDVQNAWPTVRGYRNAPSGSAVGSPAISSLSGAYVSGVSFVDPTGTTRALIHKDAVIYRAEPAAYLDVSRVGGYAPGVNFVFAPTRSFIYGVNGGDLLQKFDPLLSSPFVDVLNTPRAAIAIAFDDNMLLLFNVTQPITYAGVTYPASRSRWWNSAVGNFEDFAPSLATKANTGTLDDQDGSITAAIAMNGYVVVFKRSAIYVGEPVFQGDISFAWRRANNECGCVGPFALTQKNNTVYFVSPSNGGELCSFDGRSVAFLSKNIIGKQPRWGSGLTDSYRSIPAAGAAIRRSVHAASFDDLILVLDSSYTASPRKDESSRIVAFDIATGRFGVSNYTEEDATYWSPSAIWNGAENKNAALCVSSSVIGGAPETKISEFSAESQSVYLPATYKKLRESRTGQKFIQNAAQIFTYGSVPATATLTVAAQFPTGSATATYSPSGDGTFTHGNISAQRVESTLTIAQDCELADFLTNGAPAGTATSKGAGWVN